MGRSVFLNPWQSSYIFIENNVSADFINCLLYWTKATPRKYYKLHKTTLKNLRDLSSKFTMTPNSKEELYAISSFKICRLFKVIAVATNFKLFLVW